MSDPTHLPKRKAVNLSNFSVNPGPGYMKMPGSVFLGYHETGTSYKMPAEGWKIHISAYPDDCQKVADLLLPIIQRFKVGHKLVEKPLTLLHSQISRTGPLPDDLDGKFITIYPISVKQAWEIIDELRPRLVTYTGPVIRGEKKIAANLYVRYGAFQGNSILNKESYELARKTPGGFRGRPNFTADVRGKVKPDWVPDFPNSKPNKTSLSALHAFPSYGARYIK